MLDIWQWWLRIGEVSDIFGKCLYSHTVRKILKLCDCEVANCCASIAHNWSHPNDIILQKLKMWSQIVIPFWEHQDEAVSHKIDFC